MGRIDVAAMQCGVSYQGGGAREDGTRRWQPGHAAACDISQLCWLVNGAGEGSMTSVHEMSAKTPHRAEGAQG